MKRSIDYDTYLNVLRWTNYACGYCGEGLDEKTATIDHKTPRILGGSDDIDNLVAACRKCNSQKGHKTVEEFRHFIFDSIARGLNKSFDDLCKVSRFISDDEIREIETALSVVRVLLKSKADTGKVLFFFERLERFKTKDERGDVAHPHVTIQSFQ